MVRTQAASTITIAGLAREGGVGVETVRYYQRRGLLDVPPQEAGGGTRGGVRRYDMRDVTRLRFIRGAQAAGFSLAEIKELLALEATDDRVRVRALARSRASALDAKIASLQTARDSLRRLEKECAMTKQGPCPILDAFEHG